MDNIKLSFYTQNEDFPFYIQTEIITEAAPFHRHANFSELIIVLDGSGIHCIEGDSFHIKKGDVFVVGMGKSHGFSNPEKLKLCRILFRDGALFNGEIDIKDAPAFKTLFLPDEVGDFDGRLILPPDYFLQIALLLDNMQKEFDSRADGRKAMLSSYFMLLAVTLSRLKYNQSEKSARSFMNVENIAAYIESHCTEKFSLTELSEMSHYSTRQFSRIFEGLYGTTPQKYILTLRLQRACTLLRETELSIEDTALQCGFGDGNYFSRVFRKSIGMAPMQYRKSNN